MSRDRFERIAEEEALRNITFSMQYAPRFAAKLLRREHAALVRDVRHLRMVKETTRMPDEAVGYNMAISDVLALLAERKGRTRCD